MFCNKCLIFFAFSNVWKTITFESDILGVSGGGKRHSEILQTGV